MFTAHVGQVEVFFYKPKVIFGDFHWPGASGSVLVSSPKQHSIFTFKSDFGGESRGRVPGMDAGLVVGMDTAAGNDISCHKQRCGISILQTHQGKTINFFSGIRAKFHL